MDMFACRPYKLLFFIAALWAGMLIQNGYAEEEKPMTATGAYSLITSDPKWLNVSRALAPDDLKGRIILLDFWTYCCINCMHVIPDLHALEEQFGNKLTVIGVHSAKFANEKDSDNIRNAILRYGITHPVVNDSDFKIWQGFGVRAWPTFVLINPHGLVQATYSGEGNRSNIARDVEALLAKNGDKTNTSPLPIALEKDKAPPSVLSFPGKLTYAPDVDGKPTLFVADSGHQQIVLMTLDGAIFDTIGSGKTGKDDGAFADASFHTPQGVLYKNEMLYIADTDNHLLRAADLKTRKVTTLAGIGIQGNVHDAQNAPALKTPISSPWDLAFYPDENHIAIAMAGTHQLWSYDTQKKTVSVIAGNGNESIDDGAYPDNSLSQPSGLSAFDVKLYFVDAETSSLRVFENGKVTTLIGTGLFDFGYKEGKQGTALMQHPLGLFADESGVYIADSYNHSIRKYDPKTGALSNFAGHGERGNKNGALAEAAFNEPGDIIKIGDQFYVADTNNNEIRVIDPKTKTVSALTVSQPTAAPEFSEGLPNLENMKPMEIAADASVAIELKKGWHINADAPSYLALFDTDKKPVASFDRDTVKTKSLHLPALKTGAAYRLQGTLYYCEDAAGSQCLIKSFDAKIIASGQGKNAISLKLN